MTNSSQSEDSPAVQCEGDYEAARRYREKLTAFVESTDVDNLAKRADPVSAKDARELALAEQSARSRSKGDDPADVAIMYSQQTSRQGPSVAVKAYELWQARGSPHGSPDLDWYEAERLSNAGESSSQEG